MSDNQNIFLPGGFKIFRILKSQFHFINKTVLIIGAGSEKIAEKMVIAGAQNVKMIVNDLDSLMNAKISVNSKSQIDFRIMEFQNTDFKSEEFDLVYAQGSISVSNRNKIVKEIKRILKVGGVLCVGEITSLTKTHPAFIKNIFDSSDLLPLFDEEITTYYQARGFEVVYQQDISSSLRSFYENAAKELKEKISSLDDKEKSHFKKLLNKISHESNAYLKLGADKYIGMKMLILKKEF